MLPEVWFALSLVFGPGYFDSETACLAGVESVKSAGPVSECVKLVFGPAESPQNQSLVPESP